MVEVEHFIADERRTPVSFVTTCNCGWRHETTRRQNAWARAAKIRAAVAEHMTLHRKPVAVRERHCGWCGRGVAEAAKLRSCSEHPQCTGVLRKARAELFCSQSQG